MAFRPSLRLETFARREDSVDMTHNRNQAEVVIRSVDEDFVQKVQGYHLT